MDKKNLPLTTMSGIRAKLVSAVAMLLVAVTMVVSSTYAWFTLSTAPEVSGITTAVGANGALEIWLNSTSTYPNDDQNKVHGNIVGLADHYGLEKINLMPSQLVPISLANGTQQIPANILSIPQYGANGKLTGISGERTSTGTYNGVNFFSNEFTGVRGVGVASGLTDRQYAFRNAKASASTNATLAKNTAAVALSSRGDVLGAIVIKKVEGASAYTQAEVTALSNMITDLSTAIGYIETAYEEILIAYAASGVKIDGAELPDQAYLGLRAAFEGDLTLEKIVGTGEGDYNGVITITYGAGEDAYSGSVTIPETYLAPIRALVATKAKVAAAQTAIPTGKEEYTWTDLSTSLYKLMDISTSGAVTLNDFDVSGDLDIGAIAGSIMNKGVNISLNEGSGVFEEIADHCGNFEATVTMKNITVKGVPFESLNAKMNTKSTDPATKYLAAASTAVAGLGEPAGATAGTNPMTEFYGYIIDLGFQTNAASSNLLLQTTPVDRIYKDNNNEATQGKGSYMSFKSTGELTNDQVKNLMNCIRIVFFETGTNNIIGYAGLDTANATVGADGVTAYMYMLKGGVLQNGTGDEATNKDSVITDMPQNTPKNISVLVYLDGTAITNANVAAVATQSVTGSMNIQFSSSADLKPMEYGDLHTPNQDTND